VLNQDGVLVIGSLTIEPSGGTPPGGIDTQMLRGLPLGAYREQLVARVAQRLVTRPEQAEKLAGLAKAKPPRGRPASVDDDHRATALAYLAAQRELTEAGQPLRGLNKLLAARAGVDEETMRTRIKVSTKGEWLGPGRQGRAGRSPGRRLLDWIQEGN
jgi:hypothetical protein